jgi:hypothetical protein
MWGAGGGDGEEIFQAENVGRREDVDESCGNVDNGQKLAHQP